jgi:hypothetical protein
MDDDMLDQQLAEAETLVMRLRQRKNERALISRLPVEILIQVFSNHCASDRHPHIRLRTPPPWLAVTHVCQRWRGAALSCPFLWVNIISTNYRWAEEMLERSRDVPIHITIDDGGSTQMPCELRTARLLFSEIHRAQSLVMTSTHTILACMSILFDAEAAPLLQELIITNFHPTSALDLIARPLFSGKTPSLQFLSLYRCRVLWSSPLLQSDLVYLSVSHIPHEHRPPLYQVLEVLRRLARLECLQLDESLPIHISSPGESITSLLSVERLFLHRLRFFSLCARSALDILDLTARVLVPTSALFQLICEEFERYTSDTDSGDVMLAALASHLCAPRDTPTNSSSTDLWAPVRSLHVHDIPAARSWSLFAGTSGPADADVDADTDTDTDDDNDSDDGPDAQGSHYNHHNRRRRPRKSKGNNRADADIPPPNPTDEPIHILSLHLRWHAYPTSARAAASFIERAARLPALVHATTLLIESALFESGRAWRTAFARARHVRAVFAGGNKAAAGAAQMLRDVGGQHPRQYPGPLALARFRSGQDAGSDTDAHADAGFAADVAADADVYAAIARLLPCHLTFERPTRKPPRVLLPKLRRLAIASANFENVEGGLFESLHAGLLARREGEGGPLAQLSIRRCDVLKEQLDVLGPLVRESRVRWDGVSHAVPSPSPASEADDGNAQGLTLAHAATAGQGNGWYDAATIVEEPEMGHDGDDLPPAEGQSPLLLPGELDGLDED